MVRKINDHNKNKEKKLMEREEKKKAQEEKVEETKPFFNWKSMLIVLAGATFAVTLFPFMLSFIGIPIHIGSVIGNTFITSFACAWTRFFVDNKKGFCKEFWQQYAVFAIIFGCISYFLIYRRAVK
jgi:hypothetical protein